MRLSPRSWLAIVVTLAVALAAGWALASNTPELAAPRTGAWKSAGALAFGPGGVLFVGDSEGAAIYALETRAGSPPAAEQKLAPVRDLDEKLAAYLGTTAREVAVNDMAVHPADKAVYLSLTRGRGQAAQPALLRLARDGSLSEVPLDPARTSRLDLANAPAPDAKRGERRLRGLTITDMELVDGELYVAGLSNEEFASVLRRVPYPFGSEVKATGLEIYHGAHGTYETFAPIYTFIPFEAGGKRQILASYVCTPLVAFPLDEVKTAPRLRGKTLAELGWGNVPFDMVPYESAGQRYVLMANSSRGTMKMRLVDIEAALGKPGIDTKSDARTGVAFSNSPVAGVVQLADLDTENVLVLSRDLSYGGLTLAPRAKDSL